VNAPPAAADAFPVRLAHLSDIHLFTASIGWHSRDWFTKRATGWLNYRWLGRQARFRHADAVGAALAVELRQRRPDHVVFSGDATTFAFPEEFRHAAAVLGVSSPDPLPGLAVPGNHDYYTVGAAAAGWFECSFAPWQTGRRVGEAIYPFAQRVGPLWLVGVNSSSGNRWPWDSAGRVGRAQLDRLAQLLSSLDAGPRILVTHYPVCLASGRPEPVYRRLLDLKELIRAATAGGVCLWLHGHRHHPYHLSGATDVPFPIICVGSGTQTGIWTYNEYSIRPPVLQAVRRTYHAETNTFRDAEAFELRLAC
jgi:3',5'-cyclic AMP phosphodiesterase CpdA